MATKSYNVNPQAGWTQVLSTATKATVRISAYPHTHPFEVWSAPSGSPTAATQGTLVCHHPFQIENFITAGNVEAFYVRVKNPGNQTGATIRIDVYTDGGTLI